MDSKIWGIRSWGNDAEYKYYAGSIGHHTDTERSVTWFFDSKAQRDAEWDADKSGGGRTKADHPFANFVCVAHLVLRYDGKDYPYDYTFGTGYAPSSAKFMWTDGNYACDCNRSNFLHAMYPEVPEIDECGGTIELVSAQYVLEWIDPDTFE